ncbi:hypothetical protein O181_104810 [Austropuccinia psidii MF-1]|uniref:CCHC-type domain-containing protein n=1 Tax=Austropuccinia psidii MF-1 TaxID=1389203 RepID=A0A9Q3JKL4_9BASI|nr:hypothetical protein [Austropuccinia psidii MF-1]
MNKARSPSQYQDGDGMSYSEKEALKQLPEVSSWPIFSGTGKYDHMELIDYIDGLFIDVLGILDYWITARLNTAFKGHASIWYTEMKEIHGGRVKSIKSTVMVLGYGKQPFHLKMTNTLWTKIHMSDDIANTLQDISKRTNIGKFTPYKNSSFKEKQPFRVEFEDKPKERVAEVTKKKNSCHNCGSTDHYANNCPKAKKKFYAIEKVPEEESPTEDSESDSMGDAIREKSDDDQDPREEFLVEYQEETPLEIQEIQLEAGMPQDTANKDLCKHTQDAQKFLWSTLLHSGKRKSGQPLPKLGRTALPTKAKNFKSASGKMTSIGTIIKEIIIPNRKGFLLGTDYQRIYGIEIYNSKDRHITIGTNKEKKFLPDIYQISSQDPLEEILNEFKERQPAFAIGEEPLGKIKGHDIKLYLDVERPYPPMLRRPPYAASLETRKEIEKQLHELLNMDFIRKIGHNEIMEITTPVLITWHDGKSRLCGGFSALNNYTKADRYPSPRIPHDWINWQTPNT